VLSLTARSRWPGHGLFVCAAGYARPNARSSRSAASFVGGVLAIASVRLCDCTRCGAPIDAASSSSMPKPPTLDDLRRYAVARTLFKPTTLARAIDKLGFVQADPIRAPARAQDLILRHRVAGYRAGDLERRFAGLGLEEDFLYAYGFMPRETYRLLHPRTMTDRWGVADEFATRVLDFVRERGPTHPTDLAEQFGRDRAVNGWGGFSKATTRALQSLHYHGLLRVVGRRDGIRLYEAAAPM